MSLNKSTVTPGAVCRYPDGVVLINPTTGEAYAASDGSGGATAAKQDIQITAEQAIRDRLPVALTALGNLKEALQEFVVNTTTLQDAVSATGNGEILNVSGMSVAVLQISGGFVATVNFEASNDDTTWYAIKATQIGGDNLVQYASAPGLYRLSVAGLKSIRARVTWGSGTSVTVTGRATTADSHAKTVSMPGAIVVSSTAYEAGHVISNVPATFLGLSGYNSNTTGQFIQVHNATAAPADAVAPVEVFYVPAQTAFAFNPCNDRGDAYTVGIYVCNSSTGPTKTIGAADCWFVGRKA